MNNDKKLQGFGIIPPGYKPIAITEEDILKESKAAEYRKSHDVPDDDYWICFCGMKNTGIFCCECGTNAPKDWGIKL